MRDPEALGQVISDQVQNFRTVFDSKVKSNEEKISKTFDELSITKNIMNALTQRMSMFEKTTVSKDDLKVYSNQNKAVLAKLEETIDEKIQAVKDQLHLA